MIVRDPLVYATYYYLHQAAGDSSARRADRFAAFADEVQRMAHAIAGWLALSHPDVPALDAWPGDFPRDLQPLMPAQTLHGRTNASAVLRAYVLRNMLLLRVVVARGGEHEQAVWQMLDEALGPTPTAEAWLDTVRYWCGVAPRLPEELEQTRTQPIQAPFGVLCLGHGPQAHVLVYPDARTESRANTFLSTLAPRLDWYPVQARHHMDTYTDYVASVARRQQHALDRVARSAQTWMGGDQRRDLLRSLAPLHGELDSLEALHRDVSGDLTATHGAVRELRTLAADYRLELMQSGLWGAAPMVWQAEVAMITTLEEQVAADVEHIETTLRRIEFLLTTLQTRIAVQQSERARLFAYVVVMLVAAMLLVLVADADPLRLLLRLGMLALLALAGWGGWQFWQRRAQRHTQDGESD